MNFSSTSYKLKLYMTGRWTGTEQQNQDLKDSYRIWGICITFLIFFISIFLPFKPIFFEGSKSLLHAVYPFWAYTFGSGVFVTVVRNHRKIEGSKARVAWKENLLSWKLPTPCSLYNRKPLEPRVADKYFDMNASTFAIHFYFSLHIGIWNSFKIEILYKF